LASRRLMAGKRKGIAFACASQRRTLRIADTLADQGQPSRPHEDLRYSLVGRQIRDRQANGKRLAMLGPMLGLSHASIERFKLFQ
jgi:hypothetical protein